jgi:hypothetical protein
MKIICRLFCIWFLRLEDNISSGTSRGCHSFFRLFHPEHLLYGSALTLIRVTQGNLHLDGFAITVVFHDGLAAGLEIVQGVDVGVRRVSGWAH